MRWRARPANRYCSRATISATPTLRRRSRNPLGLPLAPTTSPRPLPPRIPPASPETGDRSRHSPSLIAPSIFCRGLPQAGQEKLTLLRVSERAAVPDHDGVNGAQPHDNFVRVGKPAHMRVAGREITIRQRKTRILLDREEQFRHGFLEAFR